MKTITSVMKHRKFCMAEILHDKLPEPNLKTL